MVFAHLVFGETWQPRGHRPEQYSASEPRQPELADRDHDSTYGFCVRAVHCGVGPAQIGAHGVRIDLVEGRCVASAPMRYQEDLDAVVGGLTLDLPNVAGGIGP